MHKIVALKSFIEHHRQRACAGGIRALLLAAALLAGGLAWSAPPSQPPLVQVRPDNQLLVDLLNRVERLEDELRRLRGELELYRHQHQDSDAPAANPGEERRRRRHCRGAHCRRACDRVGDDTPPAGCAHSAAGNRYLSSATRPATWRRHSVPGRPIRPHCGAGHSIFSAAAIVGHTVDPGGTERLQGRYRYLTGRSL